MGSEAEKRNEGQLSNLACEDGWYFLRRDAVLLGTRYRAGTLVECLQGECFVQHGPGDGIRSSRRALPIDMSMVCNTSNGGASLYEVWQSEDGRVYARPVLTDMQPQVVEPLALNINIAREQSCVCVRFGNCFLPLELSNW